MEESVTATAESASLLETTLNMASAGALSLEDYAGYLTGTLKGFGDEASNAQFYADLMAKGATLPTQASENWERVCRVYRQRPALTALKPTL